MRPKVVAMTTVGVTTVLPIVFTQQVFLFLNLQSELSNQACWYDSSVNDSLGCVSTLKELLFHRRFQQHTSLLNPQS